MGGDNSCRYRELRAVATIGATRLLALAWRSSRHRYDVVMRRFLIAIVGLQVGSSAIAVAAPVDVLIQIQSTSSGYCFRQDMTSCPGSCGCLVVWDGVSTNHSITGPCSTCDAEFTRIGELSVSFSVNGPSVHSNYDFARTCTCTSTMEAVNWTIQFTEPVYAELIGYVQFAGIDWGLPAEPRTTFSTSNAWSGFSLSSWSGTHRFTRCRMDLDASGKIDGADLALLLSNWGTNILSQRVDFDGSGAVDGGDIALLLVQWGDCAP